MKTVAEIVMGQSPPSSTYNTSGTGMPFVQGKADVGDRYPSAKMYCGTPVRIAEDKDGVACRFDLLCFNPAISIIEATPCRKGDMRQVIKTGNYLCEHSMNIPAVAKKKAAIDQVGEDLRELIRFNEPVMTRNLRQLEALRLGAGSADRSQAPAGPFRDCWSAGCVI